MIYDVVSVTARIIFKQRSVAELARGLEMNSTLSPTKIKATLDELKKFKENLDRFNVKNFRLIATDAVRQAKNSKEFIDPVERLFNHKLEVISGEEEARLGANSVLLEMSDPFINGVVGDLGGGSLELTEILDSSIGSLTSLELGHQRLADISEAGIEVVKKKIDSELSQIPWLKESARDDLTFYPLGGRWRKLAFTYMKKKNYPLKIVSNFKVPATEMLSLINKMKIPKKPKRNTLVQYYSAYLLSRILEIGNFKSVDFASTGLREGALMEIFNRSHKDKEDILLESVKIYSQQIGIYNEDWINDFQFYKSLYASKFFDLSDAEKQKFEKVLRLFSLLKDISKFESDDYRSESAFGRALNLPVLTLDHEERILLALLLYERYEGKFKTRFTSKWIKLLRISNQVFI